MGLRRKYLQKLVNVADFAQPKSLGVEYYVNNITGNDSNDGLSWETALAQINRAIALSEVGKSTPAPVLNQMVRNRIFVQGTADPYTALTTLPNFCDIIGIGADPRGNGSGIARVGADTGSGGGVTGTATARGMNVYNIQFQAGVDNYAFQAANLYRSVFENCAFGSNGSPGGSPAVSFEVGKASGLVIRNCHWINASSKTAFPAVGLNVTSTHFHHCLVENCYIAGKTAGIVIAAACVNGYGSIVRNCYIGWGGSACDIGVDDNAAEGHIIYADCYVFATDAFDLANNGAGRIIGCVAANTFAT